MATPAAAGGLRARVLALTREAAGPLGFEPAVAFTGPVDTVPDHVTAEVLAVLRESLTNVARHARARRTEVEVEQAANGDVVLRVIDDGAGLPAERREGGRGLVNMAARATNLGGNVVARARPEGGTLVEWRVPGRPGD